jgi:hypothetical protein
MPCETAPENGDAKKQKWKPQLRFHSVMLQFFFGNANSMFSTFAPVFR